MFLEIHNEEVKDLLHPDTPARVLLHIFCPLPTPHVPFAL